MLQLHFVENERSFQLGERVQLQPNELYDTIVTLWRFGLTVSQSIETYVNSLGIQCSAQSDT